MPGPQVKNWKQYEKLRTKGFSKSSAARITNASAGKSAEHREDAAERRHETRESKSVESRERATGTEIRRLVRNRGRNRS